MRNPVLTSPFRTTARLASLCLGACLLLPAHAAEPAAAVLLESPRLVYPQAALRNEQIGTVQVRARILATGEPADVHVVGSSGVPELDAAAVDGVRGSRFSAARDADGQPVESWVRVPYTFVLVD